MIARSLIVALIASLSGCAYMVPSAAIGHRSNPNAGTLSPNPGRAEISCMFLAGGATLELGNTDIHLWLGGQDCNDMDPTPEATVMVVHKFRK